QECYLRALRHFDTYRGPAMKPWLFAILRNVCRSEFVRRSGFALTIDGGTEDDEDAVPLWQEAPLSPEADMLQQWDAETIRRLVAELPDLFREVIVLREINDLSYSEIADVTGVPIGTVMSRLARARALLRKAWMAEEGARTGPSRRPKSGCMPSSPASSMPGTRSRWRPIWQPVRAGRPNCVRIASSSKP